MTGIFIEIWSVSSTRQARCRRHQNKGDKEMIRSIVLFVASLCAVAWGLQPQTGHLGVPVSDAQASLLYGGQEQHSYTPVFNGICGGSFWRGCFNEGNPCAQGQAVNHLVAGGTRGHLSNTGFCSITLCDDGTMTSCGGGNITTCT